MHRSKTTIGAKVDGIVIEGQLVLDLLVFSCLGALLPSCFVFVFLVVVIPLNVDHSVTNLTQHTVGQVVEKLPHELRR